MQKYYFLLVLVSSSCTALQAAETNAPVPNPLATEFLHYRSPKGITTTLEPRSGNINDFKSGASRPHQNGLLSRSPQRSASIKTLTGTASVIARLNSGTFNKELLSQQQ